MKKYFNTREKAEKHLEYRRQCAYTRIENRKDKILRDGSHIYCDAQDNRWKVRMLIWTEQMVKDIEKLQGFDYEAHLNALIPYTQDELKLKKKILKELFAASHKTNEFEDNII